MRICLLLCLVACHSDAKRARLRDEARLVLERHCGNCHVPESPSALPGALAVYNLGELEWAAHMTAAQLQKLGERVKEGEFFDEHDVRNRDRKPPEAPSEAEQAVVRDYVRIELSAGARRGGD
jgi:hypothetical protein